MQKQKTWTRELTISGKTDGSGAVQVKQIMFDETSKDTVIREFSFK